RSGLRTASTAAKPCQGDSLEFYLITGEMEDPIPGLKGRFLIEQSDPNDNFKEPMYRVKKDFQYPCFDPDTSWNKCKPILGMKYESPSQLKQCLANFGVTIGYQLWYMQNDTYKLLVKCRRDVSAGKCADLPKPLPPGERKLPGRPRKRRIRHPLEYDQEISRVRRVMHCHRCWESRHNKSKCINAPKPMPDNFYEIFAHEERQNGSNTAMERGQYQQVGPSVDEIPKYREDLVMPPSSSGNKRKKPHVKNKSSQVNEASGSKSNLTPEHAEMMDKEAFVDMVRTDAENKAKDEEM
nr:F-box domain, leucine-rich repeat domain, L domain-like protein [Tanacetum cinerariifolium]